MCGIFGITKKIELSKLEKYSRLMKHRGPDNYGSYSDDLITLSHNRLSIIGLEARSNQPFSSDDNNEIVVFNGEIYNFEMLRSNCLKEYEFKTTSDTEVLLYAYKKFGSQMFRYIRGMYAFAIYDKPNNLLTLSRDTVGIKPLFYYDNGNELVFSSELKVILKYLKDENTATVFNQKALNLYFTLGYVPSPLTLYENIYQLVPGEVITYDLTKKQVLKKYIADRYSSIEHLNENSLITLLEKTVLEYTRSDVPVGLFFSGGTDSSLLASILQKYSKMLNTYSAVMKHKQEDRKFIQEIGAYLKLKMNIVEFDFNTLENIYEEVFQLMDDPVADSSIFPVYYLSKIASKDVKVVLSGEGGDELFYGYQRQSVLNKKPVNDKYVLSNVLNRIHKAVPSFHGKNSVFTSLSKYLSDPYSYYLFVMSQSKDLLDWSAALDTLMARTADQIDIDKLVYLENDLLKKIDFATSYASIEGRVPFLDEIVIAHSKDFQNLAFEHGGSKMFLKKILSRYLPAEMVYRNKSGFGISTRTMFSQSKFLKKELSFSKVYLAEIGVLDQYPRIASTGIDELMSDYSQLSYGLLVLSRCIKNSTK